MQESIQAAVNHQNGPQKPTIAGKNNTLGAEVPKANATHRVTYNYPQKYSIGPSTMEIPYYLDTVILSKYQ